MDNILIRYEFADFNEEGCWVRMQESLLHPKPKPNFFLFFFANPTSLSIDSIINDNYFISKHGDIERQNDNISIKEIENALLNGRVLEFYNDTGRGESALIVGFTEKGKPLHVVCGKRGVALVIITVYVPVPPKFITPYQRSEP